MDPISIALFGVAALLIFFQFNQSKKRKRDQEALKANIVVGSRVMTYAGIIGEILAIEDDIVSLKSGSAVLEIKIGAIREAAPAVEKPVANKPAAAKAPAAKKPAAKKPAAK
ncbi:MAG: preprotein translocase subunit YajC [Micrococcales bacterium]